MRAWIVAAGVCFGASVATGDVVAVPAVPPSTDSGWVHAWLLSGGSFNAVAVEFVSQTDVKGGTTTQTRWDYVVPQASYPGWSTSSDTGVLAVLEGPASSEMSFNIWGLGLDTDWVVYNVWSYLDGTALSGFQVSARGDLSEYEILAPGTDPPPITVVPLPTAAWIGIAGIGLLGACQIVRRRRMA